MAEKYIAEKGSVSLAATERPIRPTLFIALGGTGLKSLARFRQRLFDRYGDANHWQIYGFLGIDSDKGDLSLGGRENEGISLAAEDLIAIHMASPAVATLLDGLATGGPFEYMGRWLPNDRSRFREVDLTKGAMQFRSVGRMLFVYHIQKIRSEIEKRCKKIQSMAAVADARAKGAKVGSGVANDALGVDIVVIGSLAGGTGAGSFLDAAFLLRHMESKSQIQLEQIRGMLVLPDALQKVLSGEIERKKTLANGYAALRELEYFNNPSRPHPFDVSDWGLKGEQKILKTPFDVCYLISGSNGAALESVGQVYDLIADALDFSAAGTDLASKMRSCWSNAQGSSYFGKLGMQVTDEDSNDGLESLAFERLWSTRFSSFGIASVTLKIPELRQIAGIRLLRRLVEKEAGSPVPEGGVEAVKQVRAATLRIAEAENFLLDLPKRLGERVNRVKGASSQPAATAVEAQQIVRDTLTFLDRLIPECQNALYSKDSEVQRLVADAKDRALKAAGASFQVLRGTSPLNAKARAATVIENIRRLTSEDTTSKEGELLQAEACFGLKQWHDLDDDGVEDIFGLGYRALKTIRTKSADWFSEQAKQRLLRVQNLIRRLYLQAAGDELARLANDVAAELLVLEDLKKFLRDRQTALVKTFADSRNHVLTARLAAAVDDVEAEQQLDAEIDAALDRRTGVSDGLSRMEDARRRILEAATKRAGFEISSLLMAHRQVRERDSGATHHLIDSAAALMEYIPTNQDIFEAMQATGASIKEVILPHVLDRARPYWPISPGHSYEKTVTHTMLAGAVVGDKPSPPRDIATSALTERGYQFLGSGPADPGAPRGELVVVHEAHGFGIPSLASIQSFSDAYREHVQAGEVAHRHLNWRMRMMLPDLLMTNMQAAMEEVEASETAMFAIVLGHLKWSGDRGSYQYSPNDFELIDVGSSFEDVARWLRSSDAEKHRSKITSWLNSWFQNAIQAAGNSPEEALNQAKRLTSIDLILQLLAKHCFPEEVTQDGHRRFGPRRTMLQRMRRTRLRDNLDFVKGIIGAQTESKLQKEIAPILHNVVQFVGPKPEIVLDRVSREHQELRAQRVLQLCPRMDDTRGRQTLEEAFNLKWFHERYRVPAHINSLFPDFTGAEAGADSVPDFSLDRASTSKDSADGNPFADAAGPA